MTLTCPKCQGDMRQYERNGVTVDQCSECRGIFLDRGELERLVDAEQSWEQAPATPQPAPRAYEDRPSAGYQGGYQQGGYQQRGYDRPPKRKKSFIEGLFD